METKKYKCSCGAVVVPPEGARTFVCQKCGIKHKNPLFNPEQTPPENLIACKHCGAVFQAVNPICPECGGASIPEKKNKQEKAEATGGCEKIKLALLGIVGIGLIGAAVAGMMLSGDEPETEPAENPGEHAGFDVDYDEIEDESIRRFIGGLEMQAALQGANEAIQTFRKEEGRFPEDLDELRAAGFTFPDPPEDREFDYNPRTGSIRMIEAAN